MTTNDFEKRIEDLEKRVAKLEGTPAGVTTPRATSGKKLSAKEFLMGRKTGSETERALALAYFLEHVDGLTSFNVPELVAAFRSAKEKLPKNMNDAVNKNIARGFLMEAESKKDSKKAWYLTATGERYVENEMAQS
jgi:hypothetical protein